MAFHEPPVADASETGPASAQEDARPGERTGSVQLLRRLLPSEALSDDRLGPPEEWSPALRTAATICLESRFAILLWWGPDLRLIYNDAYRPMLGSKHPGALGAPGHEVWPEIWDVIEPMLAQVRSGAGATWSADQRLVLDRNGYPEECFFTFSYSPVIDDAGAVEGVFSVIRETTDRVLGERRLRTLAAMARLAGSETRAEVLSRATAAMRDNPGDHPVVVVLDVAAREPRNRLAAALTEGLPDLSRRTRARLADVVRQVASTERPVTVVCDPDPDDPLVSAWHAYPAPESLDHRPETARAVLLLGESAQRPWDDDLDSYAVLCATHVAAALGAVDQLSAERRRAAALAALDEAKSEFFTNVSHELRTPLTLITGPVEDALAHETHRDQRDRLLLVERHARHLSRLVDELLDLGRIEAGRMEPDPAPVDLAALTRTLAEGFRPAVERAGLALTVSCEDLADPVHLDAVMYERVVANLLSNALKYTPSGSLEVCLRGNGEAVELTVRDTGVGIAAHDVDRAFERFERLPERPGARARPGAGVGLAMVRQLTRLMGGSVSLSSRLGEGSTFTVRLPVGSAADLAARPGTPSVTSRDAASVLDEVDTWLGGQPEPGSPREEPDSGAERPRILVVEDHPDLRRYIADVLGEDYEVQVAADGAEAMQTMRRSAPDLVVADVMMPRMDGDDLVRAVRADAHLSTIPVLLLSARSGVGAVSEGLLAGADDYLSKPFSVVELRARVASNLERAGARLRDVSWRRAMLGSFHEAVVITDLDGGLVEFNEEFERLVGWSASETVHAEMAELLLERILGLALAGGGSEGEDVSLTHCDGRVVWVSLRVSVVDGGRLRPTYAIATVRDVSAEHEARERRAAAARVAAELSAADDLTDVVATVVSGFGELFDGEVQVRVALGAERRVFTARGPGAAPTEEQAAHPAAQPVPRAGGDGEVGADGSVHGIRFGDGDDGSEVTVTFDRPRLVGSDERVVGDLLYRAFVLALERVVAATAFADREQHLRRAIESHEAIGQAVGILVERHRWTPAVAFDQLKKVSQNHNTRLRDVAERVVVSGTDPGGPEE